MKDSDFSDMEQQLRRIFYAIVFKPVADVISAFTPQPTDVKQLLNAAEGPLRDALRSGRVQYADGIFSGDFSAAISAGLRSFGAKFDRREKVYRANPSSVPGWVKAEAGAYQTNAKQAHQLIKAKLDELQTHLARSVEIHEVDPSETIRRIETGFKPVVAALSVQPKLSSESRATLDKEYRDNMKLWIKKFSAESITDLRDTVDDNATQGYRFDKLIDTIKRRYGVTTRKAKFLARQETALFMSKYRKERFEEAGVTRYQWSTSHDARVRHDHKDLDKRIFSYDDPPIVDRSTGRKANPGEDFNCRCVDMPVLEPIREAA